MMKKSRRNKEAEGQTGGNRRLVRGSSLKLPESAGMRQSVREISWLPSL